MQAVITNMKERLAEGTTTRVLRCTKEASLKTFADLYEPKVSIIQNLEETIKTDRKLLYSVCLILAV